MEFTTAEIACLMDALKKGAARHQSYAKFYKNRASKTHLDIARRMLWLKERVYAYSRLGSQLPR